MSKPILKYKVYLEGVKVKFKIPCPCIDAEKREREAYRWIKDEIISSNDFIPNQIERINSGQKIRPFPPGDKRNCKIYGLSMFNSEEKAKSRYEQLPPKIQMRFNWVSLGFIEELDGISTAPEKSGHFTVYEYENAKLEEKFKTITEL